MEGLSLKYSGGGLVGQRRGRDATPPASTLIRGEGGIMLPASSLRRRVKGSADTFVSVNYP